MNKRVLVIDDEKEVQNDYLLILGEKKEDPLANLAALEARLFGEKPDQAEDEEVYDVTIASQGEDGVRFAEEAVKQGQPYAVAFIDMRMPPGMDGLETAKQIRRLDPDIEMVIVTAYSDRPRADIVREVGSPSKLIYLKKPFDSEEIKQLARALVEKWNLNLKERIQKHELIRVLQSVSEMKEIGLEDLKKLLSYVLRQAIRFFDLEDGFMVAYEQNDFRFLLGVGKYDDPDVLQTMGFKEIVPELRRDLATTEVTYLREFCVIPFYIIEFQKIFLLTDANLRKEADRELIKVFIRNAAAALRNAIRFQMVRQSRVRQILHGLRESFPQTPVLPDSAADAAEAVDGALHLLRQVASSLDSKELKEAVDSVTSHILDLGRIAQQEEAEVACQEG